MNTLSAPVAPPSRTRSIAPSCASPNSLKCGLQVYPQTRSIMASNCISKLAQSRPPVHLRTRSIAASKCISKLARSRPPSASPNSLDHGLQVYLQTRSITASNCIPTLARSRPPVHLRTHSIAASKCISKLARSRPRSVFLSSHDRHCQAHLESGQDRVCISYNEMSIYPGVSAIYTACR